MAKKLKVREIKDLVEHVREITGDDKFADDLAERINSRLLTRQLSILRNKAGLSEAQLAAKIHWSEEKVAKLEHSQDREVKLGDLAAYLKGLDIGAEIVVFERGGTIILKHEPKE